MATTTISIVIIFFELLLCVFVLTRNPHSTSNRIFSILCFLSSIWSFSNYMSDKLASVEWLNVSYSLSALVICVGLIWTIVMTREDFSFGKMLAILFIGIGFSLSAFKTGFIITTYSLAPSNPISMFFVGEHSWGLWLYATYYLTFALLIIQKLYRAEGATSDPEEKSQLRCVFTGVSVTLAVTTLSSLVLPPFSIFISAVVDNVGFLFFLILVAYSISRHNLFDIKLFAIELATLGLWTIMLMRIIFAKTDHAMLVEGVLFIVAIGMGSLLIRHVLYGVRQRKEIEHLTTTLKQTYAHLETFTRPSEK